MSNVFTNKHVIIAMIVAPILAVIAYFAVDNYVSEKPHQAVKGASYPLVAKSNCRYESGKCTLENGDIEVHITTEIIGTTAANILLNSNITLQGAKLALAQEGQEVSPLAMASQNSANTEWLVSVSSDQISNAQLQLALSIDDSIYFGGATTIFIENKTGFENK
jgi:hypothetical protein